MSLQIIGPGFGRTGTRSLKAALELLGFAPCHHMQTLFADPAQLAFWKALAAEGTVDWHEVFAGVPGADRLARRACLARVAPDLSGGPGGIQHPAGRGLVEPVRAHRRQAPAALPDAAGADQRGRDAGHAEAGDDPQRHRPRDARPRRSDCGVPPSARRGPRRGSGRSGRRCSTIGDGWAPLCDFLGVPVPNTPFPRLHDGDDFWSRFGGEPAAA